MAQYAMDHETGDQSQYNGETDSSNLVAVSALAKNTGAYGLKCDIAGTTEGRAWVTTAVSSIVNQATTRVRAYLNRDNYVGSEGAYTGIMATSNAGTFTVNWRIRMDAGVLIFRAGVINDSATFVTLTDHVMAEGWHCYETALTRASGASGADGVFTLWVDGTQVATKTDIQIFTRTTPSGVHFGSYGSQAGPSGSIYIDDIVISDSLAPIGTLSLGSARRMALYRRRGRR